MQTQLNYTFSKKPILIAIVVLIIGIFVFLFIKNYEIVSKDPETIPENLEFINLNSATKSNLVLADFNPNELTLSQWEALGFSEKQAQTILKYKKIVGGEFRSKTQLKKCYSISEEKFNELEPYITLPDHHNTTQFESRTNNYGFVKKELHITKKFNPDSYSEHDWVKMGFSERQAAAILKYKNYLGGSFLSKEKFKECFIISSENYRKLAPYLLLPAVENISIENKNTFSKSSKIKLSSFDPNQLNIDGWIALGFSEKQAQVILNYKNRNLKGSFKNLDEIKNCFVISEDKFNELQPFIKLKTEELTNTPPPNVTSFSKPERETKTDYSKIHLNMITYKQLKDFGFEDKAAGSFIGFRNKLGGFVNNNQILETYNIDKELMEKLISIAPELNTENVKKYSLVDAPEAWLKEHPYFKYSADRIIFYRISFPDDKKIFRKLNTKPEYEAKMKLYLNSF